MALLLDIEGTTTSISFVADKLFPYAEAHLAEYLRAHWKDESCQECLRLACEEDVSLADVSGDEQQAAFADAMQRAMDENLKLTSLKRLQGLIWKSGYDSGELQGEVFDDVPVALERLAKIVRICIYSSGSIAAQQLLFGHSTHGDLNQYLSGYFDTTTGPKQVAESYRKIAEALELEPSKVLFLTDIPREAEAAMGAGMRTALMERPGNAPLSDEDRVRVPLQLKTLDNLDTLLKLAPAW